MKTNLKHKLKILGLSAAVAAFAATANAAPKKGAMSPDETPGLYTTADSVFIFMPAAAMGSATGFVVYRAMQPDPGTLNDVTNEMADFYMQVFGKSEEEIKKELDELEKSNPDEYKKRKDEYQKTGEMVMANQENARKDMLDRATRFTNGDLVDTDFTLVTPSPVSPLKSPDDITKALGQSATDLFAAMKLNSPDAFWKDYAASPDKYELLARFSLPMSKILGRAYEDRDVKPEGVYYYKIALVDATGRQTKDFDPTMVVVRPLPVAAPEGFNCAARDGGAEITWTKAEKQTSAIGLNVYRATSQSGPFTKVNRSMISATGEPVYADNTLDNGKTYYYYIAATDIAGNLSEKSKVIKVAPQDQTPPGPPAGVKADFSKDGKALLTWDMNLETDMAGYSVLRSNDPGQPYATITASLLPSDVTRYTDETIEGGKPYYYKIAAVDKSANVSLPSVAAQLMVPDVTPPALPLGFEGKPAGKNTMRLSWQQGKDADLKGYNVYRGRTPDSLEKINMETIEKERMSFEDNGVVSGETYYYALASVDSSMNESKHTDPPLKVVAPDSTPPQYPFGVFALSEDGKATISWAANLDSDLAAYRLYYSEDENGKFAKLGGDIPKAQLKYVDEPLENGKKRWYYLTAIDAAGNESEPSEKTMAQPFDQVPPAAVAAPAGALAGTTVKLTWGSAPDKDIRGYTVWRSTGGGTGVFENISGEEPLSAKAISFEDNTIAAGSEYWYKVSAVDTSGNEGRKSDPVGPFALPAPAEGGKTTGRGTGGNQ